MNVAGAALAVDSQYKPAHRYGGAGFILMGTEAAMTTSESTDYIVFQGHVLVWAIQALDAIKPGNPFKRALAGLLQAAYKRHLRNIIAEASPGVSEEILDADQTILDRRY